MATWLSSAGKRTGRGAGRRGGEKMSTGGEVWHVGCYSVDVPSLSSSFTSGQDYVVATRGAGGCAVRRAARRKVYK